MKKIGFLWLMVFAVVMMGCASSPVVNTFMDPDLSIREHAILEVGNNVLIGGVDGQLQWGGKASGGDLRTPLLLLTPGRHEFGVMYYRDGSVSRTTSDTVLVSNDFQAGRFYRLLANISGDTVAFNIVEEANPDIWDTKDIVSVKAPKNVPPATLVNRAANAAPTQLEGTWEVKDIPANWANIGATAAEYSFTGESFLMTITLPFSEAQVTGRGSQSPISYSGMSGTFTIGGNTIVFALWGFGGGSNLDNSDWEWSYNKRASDSTYEYSFDTNGNLLLTYKGGNRLLGTAPMVLVKQ